MTKSQYINFHDEINKIEALQNKRGKQQDDLKAGTTNLNSTMS